MNKASKTELATELKEMFSKAQVAIFADYKGLSSQQSDELRKQVRSSVGEVKVLKNNIARLITKENAMGEDAAKLMDSVVGPTLVAFAYKDIAATAKILHTFAKANEALKLKPSLMGAKQIGASDIEELANLPSREVLLSRVLATMNAPATNFVGVLAAVPRSLLNVLNAVGEKKGS